MKPEKVLVVPASCLWDRLTYTKTGLITEGIDQLATVVARCGVFSDRSAVETDPSYKQIIPYAVIRHFESYFLLQRKSTQSEERLHNKLSIGVGGHINPSAVALGDDVVRDGLVRELNEELHIACGYRERLVGLINDDTTDVGRVHLGVLFEIDSVSPDVRVRETNKMDGAWALIGHLDQSYDRFETWSQIVFDSYLYPRAMRARRDAKAG
jgi:predicted NUDIX family phosphoesterase